MRQSIAGQEKFHGAVITHAGHNNTRVFRETAALGAELEKIGVAAVVCIAVLISFMRSSVNRKDLVFSEVDNGTIEVSVSASGKVVPAFEEIINSPINTRIVEVYRKGGDSVDVGTPILKLDLQSTETEYKKLLDEEQMKRYQLEQLKVNNNTYLSD